MKGNLLVVDDTPDNVRLLAAMLSKQGYHIRKALNGAIALKSIEQIPPDLILLDINMPGMNGYEVCRLLKAKPETKEIPIIFISALDDIFNKIEAFSVGGSDYITKPFQGEEVIARIENQLIIQRQRQQLKAEIQERQKAEKALQTYLHIVSHDLRNPVLGMSMILNNFLNTAPERETIEIPHSVLQRMSQSCDRQLALINSLVESQQFETHKIHLNVQPLDIIKLLQDFQEEWQPQLKHHQSQLILDHPEALAPIPADSNLLWRVFENLIANSLKYNSASLTITIRLEQNPKHLTCYVEDNGIGLNPQILASLFQPYQRGQAHSQTLGLGLGLYLCRQIIEAHQGEIGAAEHQGTGAKLWFTLPLSSQASLND